LVGVLQQELDDRNLEVIGLTSRLVNMCGGERHLGVKR
jgi:hypothetical protein